MFVKDKVFSTGEDFARPNLSLVQCCPARNISTELQLRITNTVRETDIKENFLIEDTTPFLQAVCHPHLKVEKLDNKSNKGEGLQRSSKERFQC